MRRGEETLRERRRIDERMRRGEETERERRRSNRERGSDERLRRGDEIRERRISLERERERERGRESRRRDERRRRGDGIERDRSISGERERASRRRYQQGRNEREGADPKRTIFVYQMPMDATERQIYNFFSQPGHNVKDIKLIRDENSKSKGVGYVEFENETSLRGAIKLCGSIFVEQPIMIKPSEAEIACGHYARRDRTIYVGNLPVMTELDITGVFRPFGRVERIRPTNRETGHWMVQFNKVEHAKAAVSLDGILEITGRTITISNSRWSR